MSAWIVAGLLAASVQAAPPPPAQPPTTVEGVTVTAPQREAVQRFVDELTVPGPNGRYLGQVARWEVAVCPRAIGAPPEGNAMLEQRIAAAARSTGLRVGGPRCRVNIAVVVTNDPEGFTRLFIQGRRHRFFQQASRSALDDFAAAPRPVRWWHVVASAPRGGETPSDAVTSDVGKQTDLTAVTMTLPGTRLKVATRREFAKVLLVVDGRSTTGLSGRAVADYVAFAALAQLPADVDPGDQPSILALFRDRDGGDATPSAGLTGWDRAFLRGLYRMPSDERFSFQKTAIRRRMSAALASEPATLPDAGP